ncbi:uncharacterized protein EI90DRAFT_2913207 [Cantharellus anzutake]|uniref:uncharacterized protein n=1 Tax=Cantharellus anzutake TaxID=1750568 RepID=UPI001904C53A|nr:uncharacterized protein EI90DRAFT_2913207 [Cantharellus anzutake]KAF8335417.1 hypothetical protein EI90DRAFT_2913207 [Cantharellus anzutake]
MTKAKQTRFPVARIKKIMQKDEEVGKVAQATPMLICSFTRPAKALELFMTDLTNEMAKVTQERNLSKIEPWHLKRAIETIDTFDFLREIVAPINDPADAGGEEEEAQPQEPKKKRPRAKKPLD